MHIVTALGEAAASPETGEKPMHQEMIVSEIRKATEEVFATMLGLETVSGEPKAEQAAPGPTDGVVSLIGLAGAWVGTGSISCDSETACRLSGNFLMTEFTSVNEEVLDAMAELTNMIVGSFKTAIEESLGPMGLSIPTVIYGRNFTTRTVSKNDWTLVPFHCGEDTFYIHICLAPAEPKTAHPSRPGFTELQPVS